MGFIQLFFEHAGTAISQEEIWGAHFPSEGKKDERKPFIPKIIHQVFHNWKEPGNETMPGDWEEGRRGCVGKNGDWEVLVSRIDFFGGGVLILYSFGQRESREISSKSSTLGFSPPTMATDSQSSA